MKPMLAVDWVKGKVNFPVIAQPKIDGVRGINLGGFLTGRSLKTHRNIYTTNLYSHPMLHGFDGELAAESETHSALCRITTSALNTIEDDPYTLWWLFDYITPETRLLPYRIRYDAIRIQLRRIEYGYPDLYAHLRIVPSTIAYNMTQLNELDVMYNKEGFEGTILRDPEGQYKEGRSTVREGGLLRIKHFAEEEAVVNSIEEGQHNGNVATVNFLGNTERSSHQLNMIPNGMLGAMLCRDLKTGMPIKVSAGAMTHEERTVYFRNPELILNKIIKYKTFLKGVKDKPRFPTFQSIKFESDI